MSFGGAREAPPLTATSPASAHVAWRVVVWWRALVVGRKGVLLLRVLAQPDFVEQCEFETAWFQCLKV